MKLYCSRDKSLNLYLLNTSRIVSPCSQLSVMKSKNVVVDAFASCYRC
jgi:hypothetical protein